MRHYRPFEFLFQHNMLINRAPGRTDTDTVRGFFMIERKNKAASKRAPPGLEYHHVWRNHDQ